MAPKPLSSGGSGGIPPHSIETHTIPCNPTTHTQTNAPTRPTTHYPQAPKPKDSTNTPIATSRTSETRGNGAQQEAREQIGAEGPRSIPHFPHSHLASKMLRISTKHTCPETLVPTTTHIEEHETGPNGYNRRHTGDKAGRSLCYTNNRIGSYFQPQPYPHKHDALYTHNSTNTNQRTRTTIIAHPP